jgi:hypothetical protein
LYFLQRQTTSAKPAESDIYDVLGDICNPMNFRVYAHIPPTMVKGCEAFIDKYGDGLETTMWKNYGNDLDSEICTALCKDIAYTAPKEVAAPLSKSEAEFLGGKSQGNMGKAGVKKKRKKGKKQKGKKGKTGKKSKA